MRLSGYEIKLLAAAHGGRPYGDPHALDRLQRRGLLDITTDNGITIKITEAGRAALAAGGEK